MGPDTQNLPRATGDAPVQELLLIAGRGEYPLLLAESARQAGVRRLVVVAFRHETDCAIARLADEVVWVHLGQLGKLRDVVRRLGIRQAVMVGAITPTSLFSVRFDRTSLAILSRLRELNAATVFGAAVRELEALGLEILPAYRFMESAMPAPGPLSRRAPTAAEQADIRLGLQAAKVTSGLDIGQTVVVKQGAILAVEAFEGTDATLLRAGRLGGPGAVVVKVAKPGHDMRFDIPVVGGRTLQNLRRISAAVLAVEARRTILLNPPALTAAADRMGLAMLAVEAPPAAAQEAE